MKLCFAMAAAALWWVQGLGGELRISAWTATGQLGWTNLFSPGVCTVERATAPQGPWRADHNVYTAAETSRSAVPLGARNGFYRLQARDVAGTPAGYQNLTTAYGELRTAAGQGQFGADGLNNWDPSFEGGPATAANLSRPHFAMADTAGNIYIADKDSHSILMVTPEGMLHTVAGTHVAGDDGDGPAAGTQLRLNAPNGEWVLGDGTVYVLDTGNGKVRRLSPDGMMRTLFTVTSGIGVGRGLWVASDESVAYFASGGSLKKWTPAGGITTVNNNFKELGNLVVDPAGRLIVTDRGAHRVYHVKAGGGRDAIAGNGDVTGGGDGFPALSTGLYGVRGVWFLPNGGYLLATHQGSQIWYVDTAGIIHLFVDGWRGNIHSGDGDYFRSPGLKLGEARSVTADSAGNILIVENDYGFVRQIRFLPWQPEG